jgi:hypothetical protein
MSKQKKVKKKKIRSHVKRVKLAQAKNPVGKKEYRRRLAQARRLDFFRRFFHDQTFFCRARVLRSQKTPSA